jgi:septin family protein
MKKLQERVNVIPIIAKADTMTTSELLEFKKIVGIVKVAIDDRYYSAWKKKVSPSTSFRE